MLAGAAATRRDEEATEGCGGEDCDDEGGHIRPVQRLIELVDVYAPTLAIAPTAKLSTPEAR